MSRFLAALTSAAVLSAGLSGCGAPREAVAAPPPSIAPTPTTPTLGVIPTVAPIPISSGIEPIPQTATIIMLTDHPFEPARITVAPATIITVINRGKDACNLSDQAHGLGSGDVGPGASVHMTAPDTPGTYDYKCTYYPDTMRGTLIVSAGPTPSAPPTTFGTAPPTATSRPTATAGPRTPAPTTTGEQFGSDDASAGTPTATDQPTPPAKHKKHKKPKKPEDLAPNQDDGPRPDDGFNPDDSTRPDDNGRDDPQ